MLHGAKTLCQHNLACTVTFLSPFLACLLAWGKIIDGEQTQVKIRREREGIWREGSAREMKIQMGKGRNNEWWKNVAALWEMNWLSVRRLPFQCVSGGAVSIPVLFTNKAEESPRHSHRELFIWLQYQCHLSAHISLDLHSHIYIRI